MTSTSPRSQFDANPSPRTPEHRGGNNAGSSHESLFSHLSSGRHPFAMIFAGQATPWQETLAEQVTDPSVKQLLHGLVAESDQKLQPLLGQLAAIGGSALSVDQLSAQPTATARAGAVDPVHSIPGIVLAQYAQLQILSWAGLDVAATQPVTCLGHSQGVLGVALAYARMGKPMPLTPAGTAGTAGAPAATPTATVDAATVFATARLIGAAASRHARALGIAAATAEDEPTPLLAVTGPTTAALQRLVDEARTGTAAGGGLDICIGLKNARNVHVVSGNPAELVQFQDILEQAVAADEKRLADKQRGGAPLQASTAFLPVAVPFHHQLMEPAVAQTIAWGEQCGLPADFVEYAARAILTDTVDWPAALHRTLDAGVEWIVDAGPGRGITDLSLTTVEGSGVGVQAIASMEEVDAAAAPGGIAAPTSDWSQWSPRVLHTPNGPTLDTAFSRLTGNSPVQLGGMTPTTVDPEIVAAAANAGYWAELAGGGQVTAEVFEENLAKLKRLLRPGRTAKFNAMFMDRYLWNLQFGAQRVVAKARESGAPIDGVVISAGIPELDEAADLLAELQSTGFRYIAFKPGTINQIRQCLDIAKTVDSTIILHVEDGHAGGHHSWENLSDLLLATYADIRRQPNVVLCVGGGIGTPERAAEYITGQWARKFEVPAMPVDGVIIGTAAMVAKEAKTTEPVKDLLVATPGVAEDDNDGWVGAGATNGGMTSGKSHLRADLYEIDNASARCARLIRDIEGDTERVLAHKEELVAALAKTAKPYFGDLEDMTYEQMVRRYAELCHPWVDQSWLQRFWELLQRVEARLCEADHGEVESLFATVEDAANPTSAITALMQAYPQAAEIMVTPLDQAWFISLCRKYPKPVGFVPALDDDLLSWFGKDSLWQSQDERYDADAVRIIPGPVSVRGITRKNEPIAELLGRFEAACVAAVEQSGAEGGVGEETTAVARLDAARSVDELIRAIPFISWAGHVMDNPAHILNPHTYEIRYEGGAENSGADADAGAGADAGSGVGAGAGAATDAATAALGKQDVHVTLALHLDTYWDDAPAAVHAVRQLEIPLILSADAITGGIPVVDEDRLPKSMFDLLAGTAGVGNTAVTGDEITQLPRIVDSQRCEYGEAHYSFTWSQNLGADHTAVTGAALGTDVDVIAPDALLGPCWPAIYAALGSARVNDYPVIEGLLNAVHLDHSVDVYAPVAALRERAAAAGAAAGAAAAAAAGGAGTADTANAAGAAAAATAPRIDVTTWAADVYESSSGRVVEVAVQLSHAGHVIADMKERFAIRKRAFGHSTPPEPAPAGGWLRRTDAQITDTPRSTLLRRLVHAPADMTPFAWVSGDFNPIHTSHVAANVAGLHAPLVHGMWLSATAQHAAAAAAATTQQPQRRFRLVGWTYRMFGLVNLNDPVEIQVERTGRLAGGGLVLEVTCRINGELVSQATAVTDVPRSAYVYPGQGIQSQGMGLDERAQSQITAQVWERADAHTRAALGFSILTVVRDNPTHLTAQGTQYRHPDGVLYLTQFTQVALATLAFAQTARLREAGALNQGAFFAGHSLGEYNALSAYAQSLDLETVLELVFHRGSTMHNLVPRDAQGRSNYRMGALRPNQFGVGDAQVRDYVAQVAEESGEFLEIVNYNLEGQQYAVAGTVAGIEFLANDANRRAKAAGGKGAFMLVPGIDVPFHSAVLHAGVPDFRARLDELIPQDVDPSVLIGRYIPNLVARPFQLSREFVQSILDVVPSEPMQQVLRDWEQWESDIRGGQDSAAKRSELTRLILIELLCWQFASPVRWIETQALLLGAPERGGVEEYIEIGLGAAPTLANLAAKTLALPGFIQSAAVVCNVQRDEKLVYHDDQQSIEVAAQPTDPIASAEGTDATADTTAPGSGPAAASPAAGTGATAETSTTSPGATPAATAASAEAAANSTTSSAASSAASSTTSSTTGSAAAVAEPAGADGGVGKNAATPTPTTAAAGGITDAPDLPFRAADALRVLLAYANKIRLDQVGDADTTGTLTNGVSSRLNQLLMDMSAELGLSSVEGAAEADVATLSDTVNKAAFNYKPFGPVLGEAIKDRIRKLFGSAGAKQTLIGEHLTQDWGLGEGWAAHTTAAILLGTRDGASARGGELTTLPTSATNLNGVKELIDEAVTAVGAAHGIPIAKPSAGGAGGATVDSAALQDFAATITGDTGVLASTARHLLHTLGVDQPTTTDFTSEDTEEAETRALIDAVSAELGSNWPQLVAPAFDARQAVQLDDRWASAREDIARIAQGEYDTTEDTELPNFTAVGADAARHARWWAQQLATSHPQRAARLQRIATAAADTTPGEYANQVAVVTGMTPASIAGGVVSRLLAGGATVIATASRISASRLEFCKRLYRKHARAGACLWLIPANLSSYRDVDALVEWVGAEQTETVGSDVKIIKPALTPDLFFPFAAPTVTGTAEDAGAAAENQARLLLWSVERSMTALAKLGADTNVDHRLHVILPGSPNRGTFGGDGAYGETKAAFDAITNKWHVEPWSARITLAHPRIGWVAGTGLMGGNDPLVGAAQAEGIRVWTPEEISAELMQLCTADARQQARTAPIDQDLTGGLSNIDLNALAQKAAADAAAGEGTEGGVGKENNPSDATNGTGPAGAADAATSYVNALPSPIQATQPHTNGTWAPTTANLEDMVVIVGVGEVSPWGSGRTRFEAEYGINTDGSVDLTAAGVLELAWMTGLLTWKDSPKAGWYDAEDNIVEESDIYARYRDEVIARCGVRTFVTDGAIVNDGAGAGAGAGADATPHSPLEVEVFLDRDITFSVDSEADARALVAQDPQFTTAREADGEWLVTRLTGARARVPRRATLARTVGGQYPTNFDPSRWGIPQDMVESLDRTAVWNLVTAVDAYLSAGFTPAEILQAVHPTDVAMTQGTGFGGMTSMRRLFVERFLNEDIPSDILQETLPNVIAAHTMQSFVGGYGSMIHPVGACATAAVSIEEGMDKIALGKADFVVAGAIDDISVESITGFANMNATANSQAMAAKGINERFYSRANDRRRGGFVEAQGGGTVLLARGSVAAQLGLPVYAVVAYAQSFADGAHTSIPAPGIGALAAARGGQDSRLYHSLAALGVGADDIAVISKHDTSTNANDPNESDLHTRLAHALGRTEGNPLFIISQKTLTGHAKGGAAVFQAAGLCDVFRTGRIPANKSLDCVDPAMGMAEHFVWLRDPIQLESTVKAGLLTSLGFGHVSALVALVHPAAFEAVVASTQGNDASLNWRSAAQRRLSAGARHRQAGMLGHRVLFERIAGRRFSAAGEELPDAVVKDSEAAMLLDPEARLGQSGRFATVTQE